MAGLAIGVAAHLLKTLVRWISLLCTSGFHAEGGNVALLWVPVVGIAVTGLLVRYVFRRPLEQSTDQLRADMRAGRADLPSPLIYEPIAAASVTLGFGGSAGSEGPIAYAGAAIGSNLGRLFGLTPRPLMLMMTCGAGAGIAAIFKSPIGGMLFTLEVLGMTLTTPGVMMLLSMCVTASLTAFTLSGYTPDMALPHPVDFTSADLLPTLLLGVVCGLYSAYYKATGTMTRRMLHRIGRPWMQWIVSGSMVGVALYIFPALYGEGYTLMSRVAGGDVGAVLSGMPLAIDRNVMWAIIGILLAKGIACFASNSGGGVAGDFAPTLFAGCMLGALFALGGTAIGLGNFPVANCALTGMAGVMAGAVGAPWMAIFITVEMTASYSMLLPASLCALISHTIAHRLVHFR